MKIVGYITLIFFFGACTSPKDEVLDIYDILPSSNYDETIEANSVEVEVQFLSELLEFRSFGIEVDSIQETEKRGFPDRFGATSTNKMILFNEGVETRFYRWTYTDSVKVTNAFYNWIDCFGDNCTSIFVGEEKRFQKNAMQLYVNDTSLIFIDSDQSISKSNWRKYLLDKGYKNDWNYFVRQSSGSKAKWFTFVDEKETPLEQ